MNLEGQAAIVTGGGSGLGAATAERLHQAGALVAILDLNLRAARETASRINCLALECDVADETSAKAAIEAAHQQNGPARILVNCAGVAPAKRIVGREGPMPLEDFSRVIRVNLIGTFNMIRLAAAEMPQLDPLDDGERGVIISTASIAAYEGQLGQAAYAASKGGIISLTLPAAREFAQFGIRVMTVAPGIMHTPLLGSLPAETQATLAANVPFPKRLGQPAEFADLVEHCIRNRYLNGEVIRLDGALRMQAR